MTCQRLFHFHVSVVHPDISFWRIISKHWPKPWKIKSLENRVAIATVCFQPIKMPRRSLLLERVVSPCLFESLTYHSTSPTKAKKSTSVFLPQRGRKAKVATFNSDLKNNKIQRRKKKMHAQINVKICIHLFNLFKIKPTFLIHKHTKFSMLLVKVLHVELKTTLLEIKENPGYQKGTSNGTSG